MSAQLTAFACAISSAVWCEIGFLSAKNDGACHAIIEGSFPAKVSASGRGFARVAAAGMPAAGAGHRSRSHAAPDARDLEQPGTSSEAFFSQSDRRELRTLSLSRRAA